MDLARGSLAQVESSFYSAFHGGFFQKLFPDFNALNRCNQGRILHLEGDALTHTGKVFAHASQSVSLFNEEDFFTLLVAALVHDICKPQTRQEKVDGKVTFFGHAERAANQCPEFARNVGMDSLQAEKLQWLVARHMHAHDVKKCNWGPKKRLEFYSASAFPLMRELQAADAVATWMNLDGSNHGEVLRDWFVADERVLRGESEFGD